MILGSRNITKSEQIVHHGSNYRSNMFFYVTKSFRRPCVIVDVNLNCITVIKISRLSVEEHRHDRFQVLISRIKLYFNISLKRAVQIAAAVSHVSNERMRAHLLVGVVIRDWVKGSRTQIRCGQESRLILNGQEF